MIKIVRIMLFKNSPGMRNIEFQTDNVHMLEE